MGSGKDDEVGKGDVIAQAAQASASDTVDAIERAAELNDDPRVERALDSAALHADKTSSRVGWLRSFISRVLSPSHT
jgi:hypothetical protein